MFGYYMDPTGAKPTKLVFTTVGTGVNKGEPLV